MQPCFRGLERLLIGWTLALVLAAAAARPAAAQSAATPVYVVEDLSPHAGLRFNQAGDIAGADYTPGLPVPSIRSNGIWFDPALPPGDVWGALVAINNHGKATGYSAVFSTVYLNGVRFRTVTGTTANLNLVSESDLPPNSLGRSINDDGVVVGCRRDDGSPYSRAYIHTGTSVIYPFGLTDPPGHSTDSCANDLNGAGQVVGYRYDSQAVTQRGFRYGLGAPNPLTWLETADAYLLQADGINENGDITGAGFHNSGPFSGAQAFVYTAAGKIVDLGVAATGAIGSEGRRINLAGDVVGDMTLNFGNTTPDYRQRPFLATNGHVFNLNDLIPPGSGWTLQSAYDLDDQGRILANGSHGSNSNAWALLTPRSAQQVANGLIQAIQQLQASGVLSAGNASALIVKVQGALQKIASGNTGAAVTQLNAFITQVDAFVRTGKLTAATGQSLISAARWLIDSLT